MERMGEASETPKWSHGEKSMISEGSDIVFIHTTTMSGNSRTEACLESAELQGRASFLRYVQENTTSSGQFNEQSVVDDPAFESLTAFISQGKISGVTTRAKYFERREESSETGERVLRLHCAIKVAVKRSELERQLRMALGNGGNKEIRDQLLKAQKSFIESIGNESNTSSQLTETK